METIVSNVFYDLLKKHIPELGNHLIDSLDIDLPGQCQPVTVYLREWVDMQKLTERIQESSYQLMHLSKPVTCDEFIFEVRRVLPHLENIGCTRLRFSLRTHQIAMMDLEAEMKIDPSHWDKGFLNNYELKQI